MEGTYKIPHEQIEDYSITDILGLSDALNNLSNTKEDKVNKQNSLATDVTNQKFPTVTAVNAGLATKQVTLVSGTNIKTLNGESLLGSGDISIIVPIIYNATPTQAGVIKLAGDISGTYDNVTVPGLALKEPTIVGGANTQYWRGDKTWQLLNKAAVGLGNVDNTSDLNKPISTATQTALNLKADKTYVDSQDAAITGNLNAHIANLNNPHQTTAAKTPAVPHSVNLTGATVQAQLDQTESNILNGYKINKINAKDLYQTGLVRTDVDVATLTIAPANTLTITACDGIIFVNDILPDVPNNFLTNSIVYLGTRTFIANATNTPLAANTRGIFYVALDKVGTSVYRTSKVYDSDVCYMARLIVQNSGGLYTIVSAKYIPDIAYNNPTEKDRNVSGAGTLAWSGAASISFGNKGVVFSKNSINYANNKYDPNYLSVPDSPNLTPMQFLLMLPNVTSLAVSIATSTTINPTQYYTSAGVVGAGAVGNTSYQVYRLLVSVTGTLIIQVKASTSNVPQFGVNAIFANRDDALAGLNSVVFPDILPAGDTIVLGKFFLRAGTATNGSQMNDSNDFYYQPATSTSSSSITGVTSHDLLSGKNDNPTYQHATQAQITDWNSKQAGLAGTGIVKSTAGVISYITDNSANWNTAYSERNQWDGGSTGLFPATGRSSLGGTIVGQNLFILPDPSAVRFLRVNADNTVSALDSAAFRTAIGAGTVSSVAPLTLGTTGTDLSSSVATGSSTPVITLNVPTASATARGVLSTADWATFKGKQDALQGTGYVKSTAGVISYDNSTFATIGSVGTVNVLPKYGTTSSFVNSKITDTGSLITLDDDTRINGIFALNIAPAINVISYIAGNITGNATSYGLLNQATIQSDVVTAAYLHRTVANTAAATFNLTNLIHNHAGQGTFGAGSTVTAQYGYIAEASLIGASQNYGFKGNIPASGTNNWNTHMAGTAPNYFAGAVGIGTAAMVGKLDIVTGSAPLMNLPAQANGSISFGNITTGANQIPSIIGKSNTAAHGLYLLGATIENTAGNPDFELNIRKNDNTDFTTYDSVGFRFGRLGIPLVDIWRNGNVFIGGNPTTGSPRLFVQNNSTTDPTVTLRNTNSAYQTNISIVNSDTSNTAGLTMGINNPTYVTAASFGDAYDTFIRSSAFSKNLVITNASSTTSSGISFRTGALSADRMFIHYNGKTGFGTNNPTLANVEIFGANNTRLIQAYANVIPTSGITMQQGIAFTQQNLAGNTLAGYATTAYSVTPDMSHGMLTQVAINADTGAVPLNIIEGRRLDNAGATAQLAITRPILGINNFTSRLMTVYADGDVNIGGTDATAVGKLSITVGATSSYNMINQGLSSFSITSSGGAPILTGRGNNTAAGVGLYLSAGSHEDNASADMVLDIRRDTTGADFAGTKLGLLGFRLSRANTALVDILRNGNTLFLGTVQSPQFTSSIASGTAPLVVTSTTVVANLNADMLDGQHGSYYTDMANSKTLVTDFNTPTGYKIIEASATTTTNQPSAANWGQGIQFATNSNAAYANQLVFNMNGTLFTRSKVGGVWDSGWGQVWTSRNDGASSGLDADLLDGMQASSSNTASTIVNRDASGYISVTAVVGNLSGNASSATTSNNLTTNSGANLRTVGPGGVYREETPDSGYHYTTTLNMNSGDGRQQLTIDRQGGGMKFRGTPIGTATDSGWSAWKTVIDSSNVASQTVANATNALPLAGGTMSGNIARSTSVAGTMIGTYNNVGDNRTKSNPIYVIGSAYLPSDTTFIGSGNMYGIGYSEHSFWGTGKLSGWGMYVALAGAAKTILGDGIWTSGAITATGFFTSSDKRLKNIVKPVHNDPSELKAVSFNWKDKTKDARVQIGYLAQEVKKYIPNAVTEATDGLLTVNYIQVLIAKVAELEAKFKKLQDVLI